jgi:glycerate kinase
VHVLAAPDKFRGSLTAAEVAAAIAAGARRAGRECLEMPLADGGEGSLEALGGANRSTTVAGPLGEPVEAGWRLEGGVAVIETARASGLTLAGGAAGNDPLRATTRGSGELIAAALAAGAERLIVAVGGSATTDGGLGAVEAIGATFTVPVQVACDVQTVFSEAARVFGPQKGAGPNEVRALELRLDALAERYRDVFGVDVSWLPGSGAAGGLAGGLAALGAELVSGFDLIAAEAGLDRALDDAAFVVTGEGKVDRTSFAGKVVGGVVARCEARALGALVVAGEAEPGLYSPVPGISLVERFGPDRAWAEPAACIEEAVADVLTDRGSAWQT